MYRNRARVFTAAPLTHRKCSSFSNCGTLETGGIRLAVEAATDEDIAHLNSFLKETGGRGTERDNAELVALEEQFHETVMRMSGNSEMLHVLRNINGRIRFVRWIAMEQRGRTSTQNEHMAIADELCLINHYSVDLLQYRQHRITVQRRHTKIPKCFVEWVHMLGKMDVILR